MSKPMTAWHVGSSPLQSADYSTGKYETTIAQARGRRMHGRRAGCPFSAREPRPAASGLRASIITYACSCDTVRAGRSWRVDAIVASKIDYVTFERRPGWQAHTVRRHVRQARHCRGLASHVALASPATIATTLLSASSQPSANAQDGSSLASAPVSSSEP